MGELTMPRKPKSKHDGEPSTEEKIQPVELGSTLTTSDEALAAPPETIDASATAASADACQADHEDDDSDDAAADDACGDVNKKKKKKKKKKKVLCVETA